VTLEFDEKRLHFSFDEERWSVLQWDHHPAYRGGIHALPGTKAVDFVGIHHGESYFIEVTDFREHRIETKHQLTSGQLVDEVAAKLRDTLAGLVWACGRAPLDERDLASFVRPLVNRSRKVPVIVWLEEDRLPDAAELDVLQVGIGKKLRWLNAKVLVTSRALAEQKPLPGVSVTRLPRSS
jgi:hypothetical protein